MPKKNKKNGSEYWTLNALVDRFYTSRFNRDNMHDPAPGEDIDDSRIYRVYNKGDVKELLHTFFEYFEWLLGEENISKFYLNENLMLSRESKLPMIRKANIVDEKRSPTRCKNGEYYVTRGKYVWTLFVTGKPYERMIELKHKDPDYIKKYEELQPIVDERNKKINETKD